MVAVIFVLPFASCCSIVGPSQADHAVSFISFGSQGMALLDQMLEG